jgi:DNA-binding CsgD family transcriptional regulator
VTELVTRRCRDHVSDERSLRIALVGDLRDRVPFRAHVWALVDPETEVATAPLATVPDPLMAQLPGIIGRRYLTTVNRWDRMDETVESLDRATGGVREQSLLYREVLGPAGIGDIASLVFRDRFGCWSFLDLWRFAADPPFTERELALLAEDVPAITDALRRCQARAFDDPPPPRERRGPAVLFLSADLQVIGQTPETDGYLRALLPPDADHRPIPAGAYNVAAALVAFEAGVHRHPPMARVGLARGVWLTFRAARVDADRPLGERDIAVAIETTSPAERRSLYALSHGLSARETELVDFLAQGADTKAIADAMFLSEHTVQDHLKSIFAKTGTRNRRTLVTRLTGG